MTLKQKDFFSPKEKFKRKLTWWFRYHKYDLLPIFYVFLLFLLVVLVLIGVDYSVRIVKVDSKVTSAADYNAEVNKIFIHEQNMYKLAEEMQMVSPITKQQKGE